MSEQPPFQAVLDNLLQLNQHLLKPLQISTPTQSALIKRQMEDWAQLSQALLMDPLGQMQKQMQWWQNQVSILGNCMTQGYSSQTANSSIKDHRFAAKEWNDNPFYNYIKQSYLLACDTVNESIKSAHGLDEDTRHRLEYFARQYLNMMAPSNFLLTNPEIMKLTVESNGQNLVKGLEQLADDIKQSGDALNIRMTDKSAFRLGENIATTPGKVVFRNHLFELLQYQPTTETVNQRPILIVPPFVNKYYILDLRAKRSYIKWMVDQGHTVFCISWVNPTAKHRDVDFEQLVLNAIMPALDAIKEQTGERDVNGIGYCIGGTLLTVAMAYMAGKRLKPRIKSATLLTTLLDFSDPGEIGVFINDPIVSAIEQQNNQKGYMDGRQLAVSFSMLRENSLYWNYYVTNYLKGESPMAFDLLYWNSDNTNVPAATHNQMLREFYLDNRLTQPGTFQIAGVGIDLRKVKAPIYFMSAVDDHIAVWQTTFKGIELLGGDVTFVLGESGHIAGPMNHPDANKYGYFLNSDHSLDDTAWLNTAERQAGSWWPHWQDWLSGNNPEKQIPARELQGELDAPGTYVHQRCY